MELNQNRMGLSHKKIHIFLLFLIVIFSKPPANQFFWRFNPPLLSTSGSPDEDLTPLATHIHRFLFTTVAQSDTVSLRDNRPLLTK